MKRIGQLARETGESVKTLRYWEERGALQAQRSASGYRYFPEGAAERVRFIRRAQALGFRLHEIVDVVALRREGRPPCAEVRRRMEDHLSAARRRIEELRSLESELTQRLAWAEAHPAPACEEDCVYVAPEAKGAP